MAVPVMVTEGIMGGEGSAMATVKTWTFEVFAPCDVLVPVTEALAVLTAMPWVISVVLGESVSAGELLAAIGTSVVSRGWPYHDDSSLNYRNVVVSWHSKAGLGG
jgi:hypothetical protein